MGSRAPRRGLALAAATIAAGLVAAGGQAFAAPETPAPRTGGPSVAVTLITGDRVILDGDRPGSLIGGPGREKTVFHTFHRDGHLHVVPRDAVPRLAEGKLDPRLFDVTGLVEAGYDDARRDTVPLVVTREGDQPLRTSALAATRELPAVRAVAGRVAKSGATAAYRALLDDPGVRKIWLDGLRQPTLDRSTAQIGAPAAWSAGYTGEGVKVAVLDTGVDGEHPDLAGREIAERNFTDDPDAVDAVGHGTHVAATIASVDAKYRGVAPGAQLLDGKVCIDAGCAESWILAGMQWAADQGADVVNLSLGGGDTPQIDPLEEAVNTLSATTGALFVIAAGNSGGPRTVGSPGSADAALTVGAVDRQDGIAPFSSRGPRVGDGAVKPDITAPGVAIAAAKASKGTIGDPVDDRHVSMSGTSMATPHVAGAAALLAQQHPDWTGARIKAALMASAKRNPALTEFDQGAGRVDLAKAITQTVTSEPANLAMGSQSWPHTDDAPVAKELTYRNAGVEPVTLELSVDVKGPNGEPAPAGMFTVTPTRLTVPAGGTATTTVTADTRAGSLDGTFGGALVASAGSSAVRTPISVDREVESYDVTFNHLDARGELTGNSATMLIRLADFRFVPLSEPDGSSTVRLPVGDYYAASDITTDESDLALVYRPKFRITDGTPVNLDAREAKPLKVSAPDPAATALLGDIELGLKHQGRSYGFSTAFLDGFYERMSLGHSGPELPADELAVLIGTQLRGTPVADSPVHYRFAWLWHGKVPTGFERAPARSELAEVRTRFGGGGDGKQHGYGANPSVEGLASWSVLPRVPAPGSAIDYLTSDVKWNWTLMQSSPQGVEAMLGNDGRAYQAGRSYQEDFNSPVFGPAMPESSYPYLSRLGDEVRLSLPLFGDGAGHVGSSAVSSARTTLHRDGAKVGETTSPGNGRFEVPAGRAGFTVETTAERTPGVSEFSTRVSGSWTFRSDTVPGEQARTLPMTVVRFAPELDEAGAAPVGRVLRVPLVVQQDGPAGRVGRVRVEVSFDDGGSWSQVPVAGRTALVRNTGTPGEFASLRVKGTDSRGNAFEQTVIRAYKLSKI
ncbi:S8 family serine peptidase [Saccharothrix coeruleofusca]|uniref:Serine protease n=1 Tax=Saccharothrix coeruleofusca TaxID=33919 RepID=A0A918EFD4_9PSEU|nr:S8 family serine peptidase [Saccharothrix coeruleofusca]GGP73272.1 serine protease [Saccharothrix coeruleofusca]